MTEKERMVRDIHDFVWGDMDWEPAIDLLSRISISEAWIDYLLMEMELREYCEKTMHYQSPACESLLDVSKSNVGL